MSWVTIIVDPNDNKIKIDWSYLKKIVLGSVQGDQFLYVIVDYKYSSYYYSISLSILRYPSVRVSLLFYTLFLLSSLPSMCRLDCWC